MKVLVCGGGTGGHIYPALSAIASLRKLGLKDEDLLWVGSQDGIEVKLVPDSGVRLETIAAGAIVGVSLPVRLSNATKLVWSLGKSTRIMRSFRPDVLFMTGGYVSLPVAVSAWLQRIPSVIYLPDIEPGMAIRYLSRIAHKIACTAEDSRAYFKRGKAIVTGYPVRPTLREATELLKEEALAKFGFATTRPTLFVFGGSRGARSINRALMANLPELLDEIQVIHISGTLDWPEVSQNRSELPSRLRSYYRPFPYLHEEMGEAFRAADLVLARAGASMLGESPAFGLPAILVPYPHAWRYQKVNADYLVDRGAALRINDEELPDKLLDTVFTLLRDRSRLVDMGNAAQQLDNPNAADNLAEVIASLTKRTKL